jgi:hypothetical protein
MSGLRTWTPEDDALLRALAASGEGAVAIAKQMKRSPAAIRSRAIILQTVLAKERIGQKANGI